MKRKLLASLLMMLGLMPSAQAYDRVVVTRKIQDLYEVEGGHLYIKTRFCYEYVIANKALLEVFSPSGYSAGKLVFSNGRTCDVEKLIHV